VLNHGTTLVVIAAKLLAEVDGPIPIDYDGGSGVNYSCFTLTLTSPYVRQQLMQYREHSGVSMALQNALSRI
jgi:hypothetical protein